MKKLKNVFKFILKEFVYGGHLQSLGAASIVFVSAVLLNIKVGWDCLFIIYLIFYSAYLYNRFKELKIDYLTNPQRTEHFKRYISRAPIILFFVISVLIGGLVYFSNLWALIFGTLLLIFGFFYTTFFKKITKRIPLFKNLYVSTFFASLVFFLIVYYSYAMTFSLTIGALAFAIFVYFKAFIMQILLDVKDIESDRKQGLLTFPVVFGKRKILNILRILSISITVPVLIIFSFYLDIFPKPMIMLLLTIPFNFYCFRLVEREKYLGYLLESGEFLLWLILIFLGKFIL